MAKSVTMASHVRLSHACAICNRRRKLPCVCFLAVSTGCLTVDSMAPKKMLFTSVSLLWTRGPIGVSAVDSRSLIACKLQWVVPSIIPRNRSSRSIRNYSILTRLNRLDRSIHILYHYTDSSTRLGFSSLDSIDLIDRFRGILCIGLTCVITGPYSTPRANSKQKPNPNNPKNIYILTRVTFDSWWCLCQMMKLGATEPVETWWCSG